MGGRPCPQILPATTKTTPPLHPNILFWAPCKQISLVGALLVSGLKLDYVLELALALLRHFRVYFKRVCSPNGWGAKVTSGTRSTGGRGAIGRSGLMELAQAVGDGARPNKESSTSWLARGQRRSAWLSGAAGLVMPIGQMVEQILERMLPADAHLRCSGQLGLSVTRMSWSMENKFISEFHSRRDLIQAVCAGCFIPIWSGSLRGPRFRDGHYMDGAYSDNEPKFEFHPNASLPELNTTECCEATQFNPNDRTRRDEHFILGETIRQVGLSPFACYVDVCPRDLDTVCLFSWKVTGSYYKGNWRNILRAWHAMIPFKLDTYKRYLISGHDEMKDYLFRNHMLKCRGCYEELRRSGCALSGLNQNKKPCLYCLRLFEKVDSLKIAPDVLRLFVE